MGDVIKFRDARKKLDRQSKEKRAAENRALFGRSKAEKTSTKDAADRQSRHLDQHKVDDGDQGGGK